MDAGHIIRVYRVVISGLNVTLHLDEKNSVSFNKFSFPRDKAGDHSDAVFDISSLAPYFAYLPEHIILKNSTLCIDNGKQQLCIPAQGDAILDSDRRLANLTLQLLLLNQNVQIKAGVDLLQGPVEMKMCAHGLYPRRFSGLVTDQDQILRMLSGPVDATFETTDFSNFHFELAGLGVEPALGVKLNFPKISGTIGSGKTKSTLQAGGPVEIISPGIDLSPFAFDLSCRIKSGSPNNVLLTVQSGKSPAWQIVPEHVKWLLPYTGDADLIQLSDPQLTLSVFGDLDQQTGTLTFSGTDLKFFGQNRTDPAHFFNISGMQVNARVEGRLEPDRLLTDITLDALIDKMAFAQNNTTVNIASLNGSSHAGVSFSNTGAVLDNADVKITGRSIDLHQESSHVHTPELEVDAVVKKEGDPKALAVDVDAVCRKTKIVAGQARAFVNKGGITGRILMPASSGLSFQGRPFLSGAALAMKDNGIQAKGVYFDLPLTYPFNHIKASGRAGARQVILHDQFAPAVYARITQVSDLAVDINAEITHTGIPGLTLDFSGQAGLDAGNNLFANGQIATNHVSITQDTAGRFISGMSLDDTLEAGLAAGARFSYTNQRLDSSANIQLDNGFLNLAESGFSASGISADIHFNDLTIPSTLPGQHINIDTFNAGQFKFNNGKIRFSLENGKTIHIENLKFNWCNGIVSTEAFRLPADDNAVELTLYCDRLKMADLFGQLGAFDAQGGGTLNGRIPVKMKNGQISFDNGFLFSTPGQGGQILISNLDRMLVGIPENRPEFSQLDLAGEALKNYEYRWVKLKLNTHGDTLAVNMQLDGKPALTLPFKYDRNLNSFIRVSAQNPGSNFQGIKLDVNLTLPFNQVVHFGNDLKRIINP